MSASGDLLVALLVGTFTGGGALVVFLRLVFGQREQGSQKFIDGHNLASERAERDIAGMRASFESELARQHEQHQAEIAAVRDEVKRVYTALVRLAQLVPADRLPEAMSIVTELNLSSVHSPDTEGGHHP